MSGLKSIREIARRAGVGRLMMRYVWQPTAGVRWLLGFGLRGMVRMKWGESRMRRAAWTLPPVGRASEVALEATYMTGTNHWHQTAFAAWSLAKVLPGGLRPTFCDDGTLRDDQAGSLSRIFPAGRIVSRSEAIQAMEEFLPRSRFPLLREAESRSMFMRKFLAGRLGSQRWHMFLDSDMLFYKRPLELESAMKERQAAYMVDHGTFYCLDVEGIEAVLGGQVYHTVNSGIAALRDSQIDWLEVEGWISRMPESARRHSMLEQTLTAMLMTQQSARPASPENYRLMWVPDTPPREATLIHYLYHSKQSFLADEWRRVLKIHAKPDRSVGPT